MNYDDKLGKLMLLQGLVERYVPQMYGSDAKDLRREIYELYGEVADVYEEAIGKQRIEVPTSGRSGVSVFPNYFEAGFLSGRSFHTYQGTAELSKVIGVVKRKAQLAAASTVEIHSKPITLIQKLIDYSDSAAFAVVLLTGDDRGGLADEPPEEQKRRARQNVVFELGFFIGKLGPARVCALYEDGIEVSSDYSGVAFVPYDLAGAWRLELAREMKAAGFDVDLNKAF